ncbi:MAG TPA: response regulator transcription factor [Stellaceae bacterium]|nr:response regulator transcription factor [Stellaceae bacterium]
MEGERHLLVVDDDARLRELLRRYLTLEGFRVTTAVDAVEARAKLTAFAFDLLIVDVMMPGEDGYAFTTSLREGSRIPILLLTAMAEPRNRITGLERGADDYVVKPFEPRELVLRIRNILQRVPREAETAPAHEVRFGPYVVDLRRGELLCGGEPVRLTEAETALLLALARAPGEALTRAALSLEAQLRGTARQVDVQMTRLRRKIERDPKFPRYLQTVRGTGYRLQPD